MKTPASPHFTPIDLGSAFNADRSTLPDSLRLSAEHDPAWGQQIFRGIPFHCGAAGQPNVIRLDGADVAVELAEQRATYVLFAHSVEDRVTNYAEGLADFAVDGNELGDLVSEYTLDYADGTFHTVPVLRRFAIQQSRIGWGASAFAAMPASEPEVFPSLSEAVELGQDASNTYGRGETRVVSGRERSSERLWLYALPNPHPERPIRRIVCTPRTERSAIYAISLTELREHPLRPGLRRKARLTLPDGVTLNEIGELEDVAIDMGTVISARAALEYDPDAWESAAPDAQPGRSERVVIVEYAAHPRARLYVGRDETLVAFELDALSDAPDAPGQALDNGAELVHVNPAHRPVTVRVVEKGSGRPLAVRLHMHGAAGEYLPPRGYHRKVNAYWFEDNYGEFVNGRNQYSYIGGECVVDLPLGQVFVHISRGYEVTPVRTRVEVTADTDELTFELERALDWRGRGWVTADTHVHFLSPQTALLEGAAEGVNVVNLLASQWGEMFSNVGDFDGRSVLGATDFGGDGEFLVRVGTENRMQVLGHISLLGYSGAMITPLCTGGPTESALGDPLEVTMAEWAQRCIDQGGLVVMPHAPNPQLERAADIVLGVVNAMEMMTFNPYTPGNQQVSPYGLADWYRYLSLGYQVPVVGGSDKMSAASLLGGIRTYAHMGERAFTYENWMAAVRAGNTFVTVGPLVEMNVEGVVPGGRVQLSGDGGTVTVSWKVESVQVPIEAVEIVVGGLTAHRIEAGGALTAEGSESIRVEESTWVAVRVRGSCKGVDGEIAAHTSAVQVLAGDAPLFSPQDAVTVLDQIQGAIAYVDTLAPRPEANRYKQLRASLESAYNRLHQRMHRRGIFHHHTPLHDHEQGREH